MKEPAERLSARCRSISPSGIRQFFEYVAEMPGVLSLGVGEPDFVTPQPFINAATESLKSGMTRYTSNYGEVELRKLISGYVEKIGGPKYDPRREICVTVGVSEAVDIALRAFLDPGDEVIFAEPGYVSYTAMINMAGGTPVPVPTTMEEGFKLTAAKVAAAVTPKTKAIMLSYPSNPTGMSLGREELEGIAKIAEEKDLIVLSDEIYDRLTFDGEHTVFSSIEGMKDRTIYLNGFSKAYAMTGWRVGYVCAHPEFIEAMMKIHQYAIMCAPTMGQMAAQEALLNGWEPMMKMVDSYRQRRDHILERLEAVGLPCLRPEGAFYAFPSIQHTGLSSAEFCKRFFEEEKVVTVPGAVFGAPGEGHIRLCYASSLETIDEAFERLANFLGRI